MNTNFKRHTNRLQFGALLRWVIVAAFLGAAGLSYVYLKNQLHVSGSQRKALEQELASLRAQNSVMEARIAQLTSRDNIQRKRDAGWIKLVPVTAQAIVRLRPADGDRRPAIDPVEDNQLHAVSHERPATARR